MNVIRPERAAPPPFRVLAVVTATVLYTCIAASSISQSWPHYELIALAGQFGILLPALIYALKPRRRDE